MAVPIISKLLLTVVVLRYLRNPNFRANCLRGDHFPIRRLGWQKVPNSSYNSLPHPDHENVVVSEEEVVEIHDNHNNPTHRGYIENSYLKGYKKDLKKSKSKAYRYYEYIHHHPKAKSKYSYYSKVDLNDEYVEEHNEMEYADYVEEQSDDYYEMKGGKPYSEEDYFTKDENDNVKGNPKAYYEEYNYYYKGGKNGKYKKTKKSEKYMKDSKKTKHYYYDGPIKTHYYSKIKGDKSGKSGKQPHFPDFEYIDCDYDVHDKGYYGTKMNSEKSDNIKYYRKGKTGKLCVPIKRPDVLHPNGGSNNHKPSMRPPHSPTMSPAPIAPSAPAISKDTSEPPTTYGSFSVKVPTFDLFYKLLNDDEPKEAELKELQKATDTYLSEYFFNEFEKDGYADLVSFETDLLDFSYVKGKPVVVDYKSYARFSDMSTITPTPEQLGSAVTEAFTGLNMIKYEDRLQDLLPSNNIFVGSEIRYYQDGDTISDTSRKGIGATGIAASAVAFTLLVAGFIIYKRKSNGRYDGIDKLGKSPGDMTVAGDTVACETYDGSASVSAVSLDYTRRYDDEEDGNKTNNLGSIPENHDTDSIKPMWSSDEVDDNNNKEKENDEQDIRIHRIPMMTPRSPDEMIFQNRAMSASFEEVALQAPTHGEFQQNIMPDLSTSEEENSQMSDSELSHFVTSKTEDDIVTGSHTLEIKSILSMDSAGDDTTPSLSGGLSVRDNSSRRLRTVAEIEALLSSDLNKADTNPTAGTFIREKQGEQKQTRPRTVQEIESLLTSNNDDDTITELPFSDEDESIID